MGEVPRKRTPLPLPEVATVMMNAWESTEHPLPSRAAAELLLGLLAVENRNGEAFQNFNWGNLSSLARQNDTYWRPPWFRLQDIEQISDPARRETMRRNHELMLAGQEPAAFEAHTDHFAGAKRWINRLHQRFSPMLEAAEQGAEPLARQYFDTGYCASAVCAHTPRISRRFAELAAESRARGDFAGLDAVTPPSQQSRGGAAVLLLLGATVGAAGVVWYLKRRK